MDHQIHQSEQDSTTQAMPILISSSKRRADILTTGKGGVGKSLISGLLAQYHMERGVPVTCIDADPINHTLAGVKAFNAMVIDLLKDESLNVPVMDQLISDILAGDCNYIIDPGAVGYVPTLTYLLRESLFELLAESGKTVTAHAVVSGGESLAETSAGLVDLIEQLPACVRIVAWLNPYFGPLQYNGVKFEETVFWENRSRLHGVVRLQELNPVTTLPTFRKLINNRMTFAEAARSDAFNAVEKLRLARIWDPIRTQIAAL